MDEEGCGFLLTVTLAAVATFLFLWAVGAFDNEKVVPEDQAIEWQQPEGDEPHLGLLFRGKGSAVDDDKCNLGDYVFVINTAALESGDNLRIYANDPVVESVLGRREVGGYRLTKDFPYICLWATEVESLGSVDPILRSLYVWQKK